MNKPFFNLAVGLCLMGVLIFSACEEAAVPVEDSGIPMKLDTISFPVIQTVTYQVPPELGGADYLYFGEKDGYKYLYNLIRFDSLNTTNLFTFDRYNDSLIVADSMRLSMRFSVDSLDENAEFQLRYFPNGGDSVFNETMTHYLNFDRNTASPVISSAEMVTDSNDTVSTKIMLNFLMDTTIINVLKDTSHINFNHSFLVELKNNSTSEFKFHSSNKSEGESPKLTVFYRKLLSDSVVSDTSEHDFVAIQDLAVVEPPAITLDDTSSLAVSIGKGLRSLVKVDMGEWVLPSKGIISSAELIYTRSQADTLTGYSVSSYPITGIGDYSIFKTYESDPYTNDTEFGVSSSVVENILKINYRKISTEIGRGKKVNYGFKIIPGMNNDPFTTVLFHNLNSDDAYPIMRVIYVHP